MMQNDRKEVDTSYVDPAFGNMPLPATEAEAFYRRRVIEFAAADKKRKEDTRKKRVADNIKRAKAQRKKLKQHKKRNR